MPGCMRHVMVQVIERTAIFFYDEDRRDFLSDWQSGR